MVSKVKEMADREADAVEAELGGDDDPDAELADDADDDEDDDQAAEDAAVADPSIEAQLQVYEKENVRHEKAVAKIMGEDFEAFEACPACHGVGFRPAADLQYDAGLETCAACKGHGLLLTGAVREDRVVRECIDCQGNGYRIKMIVPPSMPASGGPPQPNFDPFTGQPIGANGATVTPTGSGWAPGYTPPGTASLGTPSAR